MILPATPTQNPAQTSARYPFQAIVRLYAKRGRAKPVGVCSCWGRFWAHGGKVLTLRMLNALQPHRPLHHACRHRGHASAKLIRLRSVSGLPQVFDPPMRHGCGENPDEGGWRDRVGRRAPTARAAAPGRPGRSGWTCARAKCGRVALKPMTAMLIRAVTPSRPLSSGPARNKS